MNEEVGKIFGCDTYGPLAVVSIRGSVFIYGIIEYNSKRVWLFCRNNKKVFTCIKDFLASEIVRLRAANPSLGPITFVMDNGETKSIDIENLMKQYNILQVYTTYNTPEYNAIMERFWRTLSQMATAILLRSNLPDAFWEDAVMCALYIYNRVPPVRNLTCQGIPWKTPQEKFYQNGPPNIKYLLPFGSKVVAFISDELRGLKGFHEKGTECLFVGYHEQMIHTYICYKPSTNTYFTSNRVKVVACEVSHGVEVPRCNLFIHPSTFISRYNWN